MMIVPIDSNAEIGPLPVVTFWLTFATGHYYAYLQHFSGVFLACLRLTWRPSLNTAIHTALVVSAIVLDSLCDSLLEHPKRFLSYFLAAKILSDDIFDEFRYGFVPFGEVFVKLVDDHGP